MKPEQYPAYNEKRRAKYAADELYREWMQYRARHYARQPEQAERNRQTAKKNYSSLSKKLSIIKSIKTRAKSRGMACDITAGNIEWPEFCPVLGMRLEYGRCLKDRRNMPNSPSVDRFDNSKGYTRDNVYVISLRANRVKSDATADELDAIAKYVRYGPASMRNPT